MIERLTSILDDDAWEALIEAGYRTMAQDCEREKEAKEWIEGLISK